MVLKDKIQGNIYTIRDKQVLLDTDLAELYQVEVKRLNERVKRNINRFPEDFMFQITEEENEILKSQFATASPKHGGRRSLPYAFSEQGVAMLSAVLNSDTAIQVSIQIMTAFVEMRRLINSNAGIFQRLDKAEQKQIETDLKFDEIFNALENRPLLPEQKVFFNGQNFDAYKLIADIIRTANKSILLIDNYVDDTTLQMFTKRKDGVSVDIYTKSISKSLKQDLEKHNSQYEKIEIRKLNTSHDRFIIIDELKVYHFGASLKDLGKKWFAFSKLDIDPKDLIEKL